MQTSLFAMFPSQTQTVALDIALQHASSIFEHDLVVVIESEHKQRALSAAQLFVELEGTLEGIRLIDAQQHIELFKQLSSYRQQLLIQQDVDLINSGNSSELTLQTLKRLYSPAGMVGSSLELDPWLTFERFLLQRINDQNFHYQNGYLLGNQDGKTQVFIQLELLNSAYSSDSIDDISVLESVLAELEQKFEVDVYRAGAGFHSASAMQLATTEISVIGGGALLMIIVIVLWLFAHPKPLFMTTLSIFSGVLLGLSATLLWFGEIHVMSLVMGSSLIGLSFDYAFHYLSYQNSVVSPVERATVGQKLRPALLLGMFSSVIAYSCLFFANLPVLNQMAVFSVFGLFGALATVLLIYPQFSPLNDQTRTIRLANNLSQFAVQVFKPKLLFVVVTGYLLLAAFAVMVGHTNDDVRILQSPDARLVAEEAYIQRLLNRQSSSDWVITIGKNAEQVAQHEELLIAQLDNLIIQHKLTAYTAATQWIPSQERQLANWHSYQALLAQQAEFLALKVGMSSVPSGVPYDPMGQLEALPLVSKLTGQLDDGRYFSLLLLQGLTGEFDEGLLLQDQYYLNYVNDIGLMLGEYRRNVTQLLAIAIVSVMFAMGIYFGFKNLLRLMISPLLAVMIAAALPAAFGLPLTLFNVLGLFLIFGIGIDYSIFLLCHGRSAHTILAVFIAGLSSLLSFGLMALSLNYAISSFGLTVGLGILSSWLVAPLVFVKEKDDA